MRILFLDIDGVLNSQKDEEEFANACEKKQGVPWSKCSTNDHYRINFPYPKKISLLNEIIKATDCKIVISSSWRSEFSVMGWNNFFVLLGIEPVVEGKTPIIGTYRGTEIFSYMLTVMDNHWKKEEDDTNIDSFVVIDDDFDPMYDFIKERWVLCNSRIGMTEETRDKAIEILNHKPFNQRHFEVEPSLKNLFRASCMGSNPMPPINE